VVVLLGAGVPAAQAQEAPPATQEGLKDLVALLDAGVSAQALRPIEDGPDNRLGLALADVAKLRTALAKQRAKLTAAVRDAAAFVVMERQPGAGAKVVLSAVLQVIGEETGDARALGFAALFQAQMLVRQDRDHEALRRFHEAARCFAAAGDAPWQTVSLGLIGQLYHDLHNARLSAVYHRKTVNLLRQLVPASHSDLADSLQDLAAACAADGDPVGALAAYREALAVARRIQPPRDERVAQLLQRVGEICHYFADFPDAEQHFREALAVLRRLYAGDHAAVARCLSDLGIVLHEEGKYAEALDVARQALAMRQRLHKGDHAEVAACLVNVSTAYQDLADFAEACKHALAALQMRQRLGLANTASYARALNLVGGAHRDLGDLPPALDYHRQALKILKALYPQGHPDVVRTLSYLGVVYFVQGDDARAWEFHRQAHETALKLYGGDHPEQVPPLTNLGMVCANRGEYAEAEKYFGQALAMQERLFPKGHLETAALLDRLGQVARQQAHYDAALQYHQRGLAMLRHLLPGGHPELASCLNNIGAVYHARGDYAQARKFVMAGLAMMRRIFPDDNPFVARGLLNVGLLARDAGDEAGMVKAILEATAMFRRLFPGGHPDAAQALRALAQLHGKHKDYAQALQNNAEALQMLRDVPAVRPFHHARLTATSLRPLPITVELLNDRAGYLIHWGSDQGKVPYLEDGERLLALAADVQDRIRDEVLSGDDSKFRLGTDQAGMAVIHLEACKVLYQLQGDPARLAAALQAAERARARVFLQGLARSRAGLLGGVDKELQRQEQALLAQLRDCDARLARAEGQTGKDAARRLTALLAERLEIERKLEGLTETLEQRYPQYAALRSPRACSLEQARACLADDEVALVFVTDSVASFVVLVEGRPAKGDKANGLAVYRLPTSKVLAEQVAALTDPETLALPARVRALGRDAFDTILGPCKERLRGKHLVVVPDGPLCFLPLELLVGEDDKYLVESHRIRYAPSLTVLHLIGQWKQQRVPPDVSLFAVGDPLYEASPAAGLPRLAHSGAEVAAIAELLGSQPGYVLTRQEASEARVKAASAAKQLARARYVHFATHGILGLDQGKQPALVLNLVGNDGEDGFLRLDEITGLKLNADLVVLSACRTGQGRMHQGEGVTGLARAFLYAGSQGVVCSLWSVDDRETAAFMVEFYRALQAGRPAAAALRDVRRAMIEAGKAPLYWAPFVLIGE
jgi:CHAT domain-containing protein